MPFSDIKNEVEDRVSSPLRGGYLVALILLNWKSFVVAFDFDMPAVERIGIIEQQFSPYWFFWDKQLIWLVVVPLIIAVLINFIVTAVEYYPKKFKIYKEKQIGEYISHDTEGMKIAKTYRATFDPLISELSELLLSLMNENENHAKRNMILNPQRVFEIGSKIGNKLDEAFKFQEEMKMKHKF